MKLVTSKTNENRNEFLKVNKRTRDGICQWLLWQWQILIMQDQHIVLGIVAIMEQ